MDDKSSGENTPIKKPEDMKLANGMLEPQSLGELFRVAKCYVVSGMLPKEYNTPEKVITALQFARELGLPGITSLREIAVINGKPSIYGTLPLSIVQASGLLEWHREFYIDHEMNEISLENKNLGAKVFGSVTIVKRKNDINECTQSYTIQQAESAGLFRNDVWKKYPERMLRYRARSMALKDKFADVLGGTAIKEYDIDASSSPSKTAPTVVVSSIPKKPIMQVTALSSDGGTSDQLPSEDKEV